MQFGRRACPTAALARTPTRYRAWPSAPPPRRDGWLAAPRLSRGVRGELLCAQGAHSAAADHAARLGARVCLACPGAPRRCPGCIHTSRRARRRSPWAPAA